MLVTASWGGAEVEVEVDTECRSVAALKRCLQEALPEMDVETMDLEVSGRSIDDDDEVLGLSEGSVIDISATQAALAAAALREECLPVDFDGFCRAAGADNVRLCRLYLETGVAWPSGVTNPLHIAVKWRNAEICALLLDSACAKDEVDYAGNTPLHLAVLGGDVQLSRLLLDSCCAKDAKTSSGDTPLHLAVRRGNREVAKLLLDSGCAKNEKEHVLGNTPLEVSEGTALYEYLLSRGCV